jgi:protein gp37
VANNTQIEWTEATWNPVTGCTKISDGCKNCYAERMALRLKAMGNTKYRNGFEVQIHKNDLEIPYGWKKPRMVFVNSMSDLFHEEIPLSFVEDVFRVIKDNKRHTFQILTKRPERLNMVESHLNWPENLWLGVTVESRKYCSRIDELRVTKARLKFISFEPLLGDIGTFDLDNIDWVIVGGESGLRCRPMHRDWVLNVLSQCRAREVPFFFKQWGGRRKNEEGRLLDGKVYDYFP